MQIDELIYEINAREEPSRGSALTRFLGRGLRQKNSVDRSVTGKKLIRIRREAREKRVRKKEQTEKKLVFAVREKCLFAMDEFVGLELRGRVLVIEDS